MGYCPMARRFVTESVHLVVIWMGVPLWQRPSGMPEHSWFSGVSISTEIFPGVSAEKFPVERVRSGCLSALFALFKPVGVVAGFEDVAVMGDAVE